MSSPRLLVFTSTPSKYRRIPEGVVTAATWCHFPSR
jgi:hypothetical protein